MRTEKTEFKKKMKKKSNLIDIICKLLYPFSSSFISSCCKSKIEEVKDHDPRYW